jgi:hypothetical protein
MYVRHVGPKLAVDPYPSNVTGAPHEIVDDDGNVIEIRCLRKGELQVGAPNVTYLYDVTTTPPTRYRSLGKGRAIADPE